MRLTDEEIEKVKNGERGPFTFEEFRDDIMGFVEEKPNNWRKGQSVFNYIDHCYGGIARQVQLVDGIDCFYRDEETDRFIIAAYHRYYELEKAALEDLKKERDNGIQD